MQQGEGTAGLPVSGEQHERAVHRPWWSSDGGKTFTGWRVVAQHVEQFLEARAEVSRV